MNKLEEMSRKALEGRYEKLIFDQKRREEEMIAKNTEIYVEEIIGIFIAANDKEEPTICGVHLGRDGKNLNFGVAYSPEHHENRQYAYQSGTYAIPDGRLRDQVVKVNEHNLITNVYKERIINYFKTKLYEFFDVDEDTIIIKELALKN